MSSIYSQTVPMCPVCVSESNGSTSTSEPKNKKRKTNGTVNNGDDESDNEDYVNPWKDKPIVKPDITFFGQALDDAFDKCLIEDREEVDLLVVIGTSLQVR